MRYDLRDTISHKCGCCAACHLVRVVHDNGEKGGYVCISGGPYDGYILRDGTVVTVDAKGPGG